MVISSALGYVRDTNRRIELGSNESKVLQALR
jgi:hypothetical protein